MVPARVVDLPRARARYGERVDTLVAHLGRVDPLADDALDALDALPAGAGWRMVEDAAARGVARVPDAPPALRALFAQIEAIPVWCDWRTLDGAGSMLLRAGPLGGLVLGVKSLVHGYASPGGNKPLILTGRLEQQAPRRLNETARFVQAVCRPRGMRPGGEGWQIAVRVRLIHAQVRRMILRSGRWREDLWGLPVNQHDMAGTSLLFSLSVIEGLRALGVQIGRREAEGYVQLWRLVSHVMGVAPELAPACVRDAEGLAEMIQATMGEPDDDSRALTRALLDAPADGARTEADLRNAARRTRFAEAICRHLVGDELADKLGVPRTSWRFTVPLVRRLVSGAELFRANVPFADVPALLVGQRYWDKVVEVGLAGSRVEFALPDRLKAA